MCSYEPSSQIYNRLNTPNRFLSLLLRKHFTGKHIFSPLTMTVWVSQ